MGARVTKNISREEGSNICGKTFRLLTDVVDITIKENSSGSSYCKYSISRESQTTNNNCSTYD